MKMKKKFLILSVLMPVVVFAAEKVQVKTVEITVADLNEIKIILYIIAVSTTLILGTMQFYYNRKHQKNTYSMNMLNNTLSTVKQSSIGEIKNIYTELKLDLHKLDKDGYLWDEKKSIKDILEMTITQDEKVKNREEYKKDIVYRIKANTYHLLNFYDCMAGSIQSELIEPAMIFNHYSLMVIDLYRWAKPLIDEENAKDDFSPWQPFQQMAKIYISHQDILKNELEDKKNSIFMKKVIKVK
jgi:hypothetical protein